MKAQSGVYLTCEALWLCVAWGLSSLKGMSGSYIVMYIWLFEALCRAWGSRSLKGKSGSYLVVHQWKLFCYVYSAGVNLCVEHGV